MQLDGYVDVATRLKLALEQHPDLRITEDNPVVVSVGDAKFVQVSVTVWRSPDDTMPARACAWEPIPGKSAFTRDSEMMNCSTSALGRALGFMGLGIFRGVSTVDEVNNRLNDRERPLNFNEVKQPKNVSLTQHLPVYTEPDPAGEIERPTTRKLASDPQKKLIRRLCTEKNYTYDGDLDHLGMGDAIELIDVLKAMEEVR